MFMRAVSIHRKILKYCFLYIMLTAGRCRPVPKVIHGSPDNLLVEPNNIVQITCDVGYMYPDKSFTQNITCQNGDWKITNFECIGEHVCMCLKQLGSPCIVLIRNQIEINYKDLVYPGNLNINMTHSVDP